MPATPENHRSAADDAFVPGTYWTPERRHAAIDAMNARWASDEIQSMVNQTEHDFSEDLPIELVRGKLAAVPARDRVRIRRGRHDDVPQLAALIVTGNLPPLFIEEFVEGFAVAEHDGDVIACGGLELYGDCGVIRSVVVDEAARGLGLGRVIADLLCEDARLSGAKDIYLFTQDAWQFWQALGFEDVPLSAWPDAPRICWQYRFISLHPEMAEFGVRSMRRAATR